MTDLTPCLQCSELLFAGTTACPHCNAPFSEATSARPLPLVMLGLTLSGCGDKDESGSTDTGEDTIVVEPEYGVAATRDFEPQPMQPIQSTGQASSTTTKRPKS